MRQEPQQNSRFWNQSPGWFATALLQAVLEQTLEAGHKAAIFLAIPPTNGHYPFILFYAGTLMEPYSTGRTVLGQFPSWTIPAFWNGLCYPSMVFMIAKR